MPRVHRKTKSDRGIVTYKCSASPCKLAEGRDGDRTIRPGDEFYQWTPRSGSRYRHVACGYPRPTDLSSRKTAAIEEAVQDADLDAWQPELNEQGGYDDGYDDIKSALADVAAVAREVGEEYTMSADSMPENLQYGSQAEAMRDVGSRLEEWADELEAWEPDQTEPDFEQADTREEREEVLTTWADELRNAAVEAMEDIPEYEG